eukprot:CAMPEP_0114358280 /NCGR_PEP_ID=MMETSP0101-20121206/22193_1 /TAXON_ID=38822 ORGANISM="Pteridomonas danica, Strain PT" /NCGR_SAMPLE_ID=MMETSP0101 /ASSEMBLY_ACC=CAM_ASM_000211 /LENGTH=146 /DNA_ID=CAMNT_0001501333 /DNA_START=56 /DNA_END=496 /DNA_ORIENTATION=-
MVGQFSTAAAPMVSDVTVYVNFLDHQGYRAKVPGRIGQTIYEVASMHNIHIGYQISSDPISKVHNERWTEDLFGEGLMLGHDQIQIPKEWLAKIPPRSEREEELLEVVWTEDGFNDSSRLSQAVTLTKELDGILVYLPSPVDDECY